MLDLQQIDASDKKHFNQLMTIDEEQMLNEKKMSRKINKMFRNDSSPERLFNSKS